MNYLFKVSMIHVDLLYLTPLLIIIKTENLYLTPFLIIIKKRE
jgi:hypothetical protein